MRTLLLKFILLLTAYMPLKLAHWLGLLIGYLYLLIPNKIKRIAQTNIQKCFPELDTSSQQKLLKDSLIETGKLICEMGIIWGRSSRSALALIKTVEGDELIHEALKQGQGVLLAIPHMGSWELVGLYCAKHFPMTSMYRPPRLKTFDQKIRQARERTGATLVPTDNSGVRALSKALKNGELIGLLPDQEPSMGNGTFAPFFNIPSYTTCLLPKMATRFNCQVIYTYAERLPSGRGFKLIFRASSDNFNNKGVQTATEQMNKDIEQLVRECPSQYQWIYKRFKTRPEGEEKFY